jgi:hypothetical protein
MLVKKIFHGLTHLWPAFGIVIASKSTAGPDLGPPCLEISGNTFVSMAGIHVAKIYRIVNKLICGCPTVTFNYRDMPGYGTDIAVKV